MSKKLVKVLTLTLVLALAVTAFVACSNDKEPDASGSTEPSTAPTQAPTPTQSIVEVGDQEEIDKVLADLTLEDSYKIAYCVKTLTNPFFVDIENGMKDYIRDSDELVSLECNNDAGMQLQKCEDIAAGDYDLCFLTPIDYEGVSACMNILREAGVKIILIDSLAKELELSDGSSVSDNWMAGVLCGEACVKDLTEKYGEPKGGVVIFENTTSPPVMDRIGGFEEVISKYPDIEILHRENGKGQVDTGLAAMENFLQAYPDMDAVMSMNDPSAQGCANAIESAGKTGEIFVYGVDGSEASKDYIREGKQTGSSAQFPFTMGQQGVVLGYKVLAGVELSDVERHVKVPCEYIDKNNVDDPKFAGQK